MNKENNSIINSPAPPSVQQTGQSNVNVTNLPGGNVNLIQNPPVEYDENGVPYTPVNHVRFDSQNSIIYLGNEQVSIPVELVQPGLLTPEELPYVNALCEKYEKENVLDYVIEHHMTMKSCEKVFEQSKAFDALRR